MGTYEREHNKALCKGKKRESENDVSVPSLSLVKKGMKMIKKTNTCKRVGRFKSFPPDHPSMHISAIVFLAGFTRLLFLSDNFLLNVYGRKFLL